MVYPNIKNCQILRVVFLNDVGFYAGAGGAMLRQVNSFLIKGHKVAVVCQKVYNNINSPNVSGYDFSGNWLGIHTLEHAHHSKFNCDESINRMVAQKIFELNPDLVIVGNLHGAAWSPSILSLLKEKGICVVAYLHDCHFLTGHCAYFGECTRYMTGCNEACPIPDEYPALAPEKISSAWKLRQQIFAGARPVPCAANSDWLLGIADAAFDEKAVTGRIHLGLNHELFKPGDKEQARKKLGWPLDADIVLTGAFNVNEKRKGGTLLLSTIERLSIETGVAVCSFGMGSKQRSNKLGVGLIEDEFMMATLFNAADVFLHVSLEEAFGQTLMEASACGVPIIALDVGGVRDIARDGQNAVLLSEPDSDLLFATIMDLIRAKDLRESLGKMGRQIVENEFTLVSQYDAWIRFFKKNNL